jgi:hypothetical protein
MPANVASQDVPPAVSPAAITPPANMAPAINARLDGIRVIVITSPASRPPLGTRSSHLPGR